MIEYTSFLEVKRAWPADLDSERRVVRDFKSWKRREEAVYISILTLNEYN